MGNKYRILECPLGFIIQIEVTETIKRWFRRPETKTDWLPVNEYLQPHRFIFPLVGINNMLAPFQSLEDAKAYLDKPTCIIHGPYERGCIIPDVPPERLETFEKEQEVMK